MDKWFLRRPYISLVLPVVLAACAGGGHVGIPNTVVPVPTLSALNPQDPNVIGPTEGLKMETFNANSETSGKVVSWKIKEKNIFGELMPQDRLAYQTPDGKVYVFNTYTNPILPDSFHPDKNLRTKHDMQVTDNGGKLFACCENGQIQYPATRVDAVRYGAWIDKNGKADLFVGGILADATKMQGAKEENKFSPTGKATYEVWALRVKNGGVVSSSYRPNNFPKKDGVQSLLTVNFNTGKLGGTIIGNSDFGADIRFEDVSVQGNHFSGSASSGGVAGKVEGAFYGTGGYRRPHGDQIGGKIVFDKDRSLNSVFGGATNNSMRRPDDTSKDLNPVN
ncbi:MULTISPECIES: Slam-dependent surface lipoprotein [unclassified Neisseria]|uniref:Slam-dependent surface lipoprotein n=1 Tax=unclassified Neisseria TaxID=2623750 RepID=UPI002666666D|nr:MULTISPECIES: Slam-dependent surface lipoprotein [unclassified Neisseria]MDO1508784.1 Slam-dependent surface lipoprotein [Neisseria sp. MVDL19-042950]MDO1515043.1 Slam-dependent surface lipoprotein [Neisseria sp. MVDL18-041461]MDO1562403.1 Slam-dependent surface lipoprotein [Neisseria sp. MVDL20-010259]